MTAALTVYHATQASGCVPSLGWLPSRRCSSAILTDQSCCCTLGYAPVQCPACFHPLLTRFRRQVCGASHGYGLTRRWPTDPTYEPVIFRCHPFWTHLQSYRHYHYFLCRLTRDGSTPIGLVHDDCDPNFCRAPRPSDFPCPF